MQVALTGGTGFLGRYIASHLLNEGHTLRLWHRPSSERTGFQKEKITWVPGELGDKTQTQELLNGCQALVHSALYRPGAGWSGSEGDLNTFAEKNILGSLQLIQAAKDADMQRVVFISTCAVHDIILDDRALDEAHPLWPMSHYGAHKAAIEKFVHSFGFGMKFPVCALRPTGIYGVAHKKENSRWYDLVKKISRGEDVEVTRGGKEVHAADVAKAVGLLLQAKNVSGECFNCYDRYISEFEVATIARDISGSKSKISGENPSPKNQIETGKIKQLGMSFGGEDVLRNTIKELLTDK